MFLLTVLNEKYFWFNLSAFEPGVKSETNICKKKKLVTSPQLFSELYYL